MATPEEQVEQLRAAATAQRLGGSAVPEIVSFLDTIGLVIGALVDANPGLRVSYVTDASGVVKLEVKMESTRTSTRESRRQKT